MKALKAIKKIAAAGLGFAFIGATIGGAMATDLGDYPAPFATGSGYNGKIIVGEKASAIDIVGAVNIASSFTNLEGAGSVIVETPKGKVVNAVAFDKYAADGTTSVDEMPMKGEGRKLDFDEDDAEWAFMQGYENDDITEDLNIVITADVGDDDCEPDDETIAINNFVYTFTDASDGVADEIDDVEDDDDFDSASEGYAEFKYQITLFGKEYYVINDKIKDNASSTETVGKLDSDEINTGDLRLQLAYADETVQAGDEIDLTPYGYDDYTLKIVRIVEESSGADADSGKLYVALMKDGVQVDYETIDEPKQGEEETEKLKDDTEDIEVKVTLTDVSWDASNSEYYAEIRFETGNLKKGDFFDENEKWKLEDLTVNPDTEEVTVKVKFYEPDDDLECELEGNELYVGNTLSLLGYLELGFVGLSEPNTAEVDIFVDKDGKLIIDPDDSVEVKIGGFDGKGSKMTFEYIEDSTPDDGLQNDDKQGWKLVKFEGEKDEKVVDAEVYLAYSNYTTDAPGMWGAKGGEPISLYLDKDNQYTITVDLGIEAGVDTKLSANDILVITEPTSLITSVNTIEIRNLGDDDWETNVYETGNVALKKGQKTDLGTELVMYDSYNQEATISIVSDAIRYLVYAGQNVESKGNEVELEVGDTVPAGAKVVAVGAKPLPVGLAILDSELSSPDAVKDDNYIVVGGPCANSAAAALMGIEDPTTCSQAFVDEGYSAGEAVIKLYKDDGNFQLLVAGYNGEDTLLATEVLASYDKFKDEFEGKNEVKVKGTALADVEIED
ncbi:MAG: hypothetical protein PWQ87_350 [Candidatus Woesearchaeota archaeon]|nr:hypothetical protein [Candidatus Woesearchaeota archaeon]